MAQNPSSLLELTVQVLAAVSTAAAAVFAALSARSSARATEEMEHSRHVAVAPVLTMDSRGDGFTISAYPPRRLVSTYSRVDRDLETPRIEIENHGSGPALNVHVTYHVLETYEPMSENIEILTPEKAGSTCSMYYSDGALLWKQAEIVTGELDLKSTGETFFSSIAAGETVYLEPEAGFFNRLFSDAVQATARDKDCVRHLVVKVFCISSLGKQMEGEQRFVCALRHPPLLAVNHNDHSMAGFRVDLVPSGSFGPVRSSSRANRGR
jgi:hypothetical protein